VDIFKSQPTSRFVFCFFVIRPELFILDLRKLRDYKFSKISLLLNLLCKPTIELNFENFCRQGQACYFACSHDVGGAFHVVQ